MGRMWILLLILGTGPCLAGCKRVKDVTDEPVVQEALGGCYELVTDLLVCQAKDTVVPLYITPAGGSRDLPVSVESYLESPENWMEEEAYKHRWGDVRSLYIKVVGYLPEGTRLRIVKVVQIHNRMLGPVFVPLVRVDSEQFGGCLLDGGGLFWGGTCGDWDIEPIPPRLRRVSD